MRHSRLPVGLAVLLVVWLAPPLSKHNGIALAQIRGSKILRQHLFCGDAGQTCCKTPEDRAGVVFCNAGLGCDIAANRCVADCGGDGQVCCDGPDTFAPRTGSSPASGLYCPNGVLSCVVRKPMCVTGACDVSTHRCIICGQRAGDACCPPDAQSAVATCKVPWTHCGYSSDSQNNGVCKNCGRAGEPPCPAGRSGGCDDGLRAFEQVCQVCGRYGQRPCLDGCSEGAPSIRIGNGTPIDDSERRCVRCGDLGQPTCTGNVCINGQPFLGLCASSLTCASYALAAAKAYATNTSANCGLVGSRWNPSVQFHARMCRDLTPQQQQQETAARDRYMARCSDCRPFAQLMTVCRQRNSSRSYRELYMEEFEACFRRDQRSVASEMSSRHKLADWCSSPPPPGQQLPGQQPPSSGTKCCVICVPNPSFPPGGGYGSGIPPGGGTNCTPGYSCGPQCP